MMESELLSEVVAELKEIKKSVKNMEIDISEIKCVVNKGVFADITRLEKRVEALEKQRAG